MKNILITHTDLDGAGCAIIFKQKFPDIKIQYHNYDTVDTISEKLLNEKDKYDKIFFADITPMEEIGKKMLEDDKFILIDHHKTRLYLDGTKGFDTNICGAFISMNYLNQIDINEDCNNDFILSVDAWDSWKLDSQYRKNGEGLNLLFGYYGMDKFVEEFKDMRDITTEEKTIICVLRKIKEDYLNHKIEQCKTKLDENGNKYWEFYIGEPQSGLGNLLEMAGDKAKDIKYIKSINMNDNVVSLYSLDIDVSEIAKEKGGGGHKKASGYSIVL